MLIYILRYIYYKRKANTVILLLQSYVDAECNVEGFLSNHFVCLAPPLISVGGVFPQAKIKVPVRIISISRTGGVVRKRVCVRLK